MHISLGDALFLHIIAGAYPFPFIQTAVEIGVVQLAVRGILAHEGKEDLAGREGIGHPVDDGTGICFLAGQDEVADEQAGAEQAVFHAIGADLTEHFEDGGFCDFGIVGRVGQLGGQDRIGKLIIGQKDIHLARQFLKGFDRFIGRGVPDDGQIDRIEEGE